MQIFLRHLYAGVSEKRGYCLYVGSGIQKIYGETVPGAVPCDALLYSCVLHPSGEMLSRRTLVGQVEYSLSRVIIILRLSNQLYKLIVERRHDGGMCAASRAFLLVEPHHHALVIDIGECQFRHIAVPQSRETAEDKCVSNI